MHRRFTLPPVMHVELLNPASTAQENIHKLISHPRLGKLREPFLPFSVELDSHALSLGKFVGTIHRAVGTAIYKDDLHTSTGLAESRFRHPALELLANGRLNRETPLRRRFILQSITDDRVHAGADMTRILLRRRKGAGRQPTALGHAKVVLEGGKAAVESAVCSVVARAAVTTTAAVETSWAG